MKNSYLLLLILVFAGTCVRAQLFRGGNGDGGGSEQFSGQAALPLTLISFTAQAQGDVVLLRWRTQDEVATSHFTVERSQQNDTYTTVGQTDAAGYSAPDSELTYELSDENPLPGTVYYRLRSVDYDNSFTLSDLVVVIRKDQALDFSLAPNPLPANTVLSLKGVITKGSENVYLSLIDARGSVVMEREYTNPTPTLSVELPNPLSNGTYFVQLRSESSEPVTKILVLTGNR